MLKSRILRKVVTIFHYLGLRRLGKKIIYNICGLEDMVCHVSSIFINILFYYRYLFYRILERNDFVAQQRIFRSNYQGLT